MGIIFARQFTLQTAGFGTEDWRPSTIKLNKFLDIDSYPEYFGKVKVHSYFGN